MNAHADTSMRLLIGQVGPQHDSFNMIRGSAKALLYSCISRGIVASSGVQSADMTKSDLLGHGLPILGKLFVLDTKT